MPPDPFKFSARSKLPSSFIRSSSDSFNRRTESRVALCDLIGRSILDRQKTAVSTLRFLLCVRFKFFYL